MFFASSYKREIIQRRRRIIKKKCSERENRVRVPVRNLSSHIKRKQGECWHELISLSLFLSLVLLCELGFYSTRHNEKFVYRLDREMALWRNRICLLAFRNCEKDANGRKWSSLVGPAFPCRLVSSANTIFDYFQLFSSQKKREREGERRKKPESVSLGWFLRMWIDRLDEFYFISFYLRKREGALPLVWP